MRYPLPSWTPLATKQDFLHCLLATSWLGTRNKHSLCYHKTLQLGLVTTAPFQLANAGPCSFKSMLHCWQHTSTSTISACENPRRIPESTPPDGQDVSADVGDAQCPLENVGSGTAAAVPPLWWQTRWFPSCVCCVRRGFSGQVICFLILHNITHYV